MASKLYANLKFTINGIFQVEGRSVEIDFNSELQPVNLLEGRKGYTAGAGFVQINCASAVPRGGLEFDYLSKIANTEPVDMQVFIGGQSYSGTGFFQTAKVSQSETNPAEASFTWEGSLTPLN